MMKVYKTLAVVTSLLITSTIFAQQITLQQTNESGIYSAGKRIEITLFVKNSKEDSVLIRIDKNHSGHSSQKKIKYNGGTMLIFSETPEKPTTFVVQAITKSDTASIGLVVDPENFKPGTLPPQDFNTYWQQQKKILKALPVKLKQLAVQANIPGFQCFDIEINCTGPKPARGYFAKPVMAKPKSLPIVLYLHAAGVSGNWCRSETGNAMRYATMGKGALSFDLNAHGMLNGQPDSYYKDLEDGELREYSLQGIESKEDVYFRGMYLRLIRTLDFLTRQQEWDGKRILVIGESQGGGQALAAVGLDHRVSAAVVIVPAMCDWGKTLNGSKGGWPNPFGTKNDREKMMASVPYFDAAHLLKGAKATIWAEIGLIDYTCPPAGVYAAINQVAGKKLIFAVPYRAHHMNQLSYKEIWDKEVNEPKENFIKNYLR